MQVLVYPLFGRKASCFAFQFLELDCCLLCCEMSTENKKRKAEDALNFLQDLESAGSDSTEQEKR